MTSIPFDNHQPCSPGAAKSTGPTGPSVTAALESARIAIPVSDGVLASHFGHCQQFAIFDLSADGKSVAKSQLLTPPPHEPGSFPKWLRELGASLVIAGGMGSRARTLFNDNQIQVVVGASALPPEEVVQHFLDGQLNTGSNPCDH